jgi:phytoene synthase
MTFQLHGWEPPLLALALEARRSENITTAEDIVEEPARLERAYARCEEITSIHSRSFHLASGLLPADKRQAARALYAFCRISDDIVDQQEGNVEAILNNWRQRVLNPDPAESDLVALAWADTRSHYRIPPSYAEQLIDGVTRDLHQTRYYTFTDLATYAYGVASTVGLMSMHIIGFSGPEAIPYAIKLGVALQLTNILRDVGEDWRVGRVYLPREELEVFGLSEKDLAAGRVHDRWRDFMRFQISRNRQLYKEAWPGISLLHQDGRLAITAAAAFYQAILDDIEAHDYNVFDRRAHVSAWGKLRRLPALWWQSRRAGGKN